MNVVDLLKNDHRKVERLFERYRSASTGTKRTILDEITRELTKHTYAEETVLYPVLRASISDGESLMDDAVTEHQEAKGLLVELEDADVGSLEADAKVATLRRAIEQHVRDEEGEIFPEMERLLDRARLEGLGLEIENAKQAAPDRPPESAVQDSPGTSVAGVVSAATDRLVK
jgi:hemerythrin superfamily protein